MRNAAAPPSPPFLSRRIAPVNQRQQPGCERTARAANALPVTRLSGLFLGWRVLGAAMVLTALGGGIFSYGFSVFFLPLRESLGISAASASLIFALSRAEG